MFLMLRWLDRAPGALTEVTQEPERAVVFLEPLPMAAGLQRDKEKLLRLLKAASHGQSKPQVHPDSGRGTSVSLLTC